MMTMTNFYYWYMKFQNVISIRFINYIALPCFKLTKKPNPLRVRATLLNQIYKGLLNVQFFPIRHPSINQEHEHWHVALELMFCRRTTGRTQFSKMLYIPRGTQYESQPLLNFHTTWKSSAYANASRAQLVQIRRQPLLKAKPL